MDVTNALASLRPYRSLLWILALAGAVGVNGLFLYYAFTDPATMIEALRNPVAAAFILEAFLLTGVAAWLVDAFGLEKPGWVWFVVLSIAGSLLCSVPAFLLLHMRRRNREAADAG